MLDDEGCGAVSRQVGQWQRQQEFPIIPNPDDPDAGNLYRDLTFPEGVYEDISEYHEQKAEAAS